jgi:hypothetical protein
MQNTVKIQLNGILNETFMEVFFVWSGARVEMDEGGCGWRRRIFSFALSPR